MNEIIPEAKTDKFGLTIFASVTVLGITALLSFLFFDSRIISQISAGGKLDDFSGAILIKALGKVYVPLWLLFLYGFIKNNLRPVLAGALAMLMVLVIINPIKLLVHRERPREVNNSAMTSAPYKNSISQHQSFPSGDTATVFAAAVVAAAFVSGLSVWILFILAAIVGFLRVAGLAHYPSDVLAGAAIGIFCGWLALGISKSWILQNKFLISEWWRKVSLAGIIIIPVLTLCSKDNVNNFPVFLVSSAAVTGCVYITNKIPALRRKKMEPA